MTDIDDLIADLRDLALILPDDFLLPDEAAAALARLQAENEKLREVLEALLCEAENIFECMNDLAGVNWHNYPEPLIRARAALATDEPRHD